MSVATNNAVRFYMPSHHASHKGLGWRPLLAWQSSGKEWQGLGLKRQDSWPLGGKRLPHLARKRNSAAGDGE